MSRIGYILGMPFSRRQERLSKERAAMNRGDFVAALSGSEIGKRASTLLWEKLQEAAAVEGFTPYPDDNLLEVYGLADEDLDEDVILAILNDLGVALPDRAFLKALGRIETPRDVVRLVERSSEASA